jgi:hypothetical protein
MFLGALNAGEPNAPSANCHHRSEAPAGLAEGIALLEAEDGLWGDAKAEWLVLAFLDEAVRADFECRSGYRVTDGQSSRRYLDLGRILGRAIDCLDEGAAEGSQDAPDRGGHADFVLP